jgi:hypothetical protein
MAASPKLTPRAKKMYPIIEKYLFLNGKITQKAFSRQEGIPLSTFQWWLKQYRESSTTPPLEVSLAVGPAQENPPPQPFIPLRVGGGDKRAESPTHYVIEYPNGVIIRISGSLPQSGGYPEVEFLRWLILGNEG